MPTRTAPPTTHEELLARYQQLRQEHEQARQSAQARRTRVLQILLADVLLIGFLGFGMPHGSAAWLLMAFAAAAGLIWWALHLSPEIGRQERLLSFYDRNLRRVDGTEPQSGRTGLEAGHELRVPGHLYEHDLDLLGPDSLFGLLATVRTGPGERGLANLLLLPATQEETLLRQEAVRELLPQTDLRERIALLGNSRFHQVSARFFDDWLDEPPPVFPGWPRYVLLLTTLTAAGLLLTALLRKATWDAILPNLGLDLVVQGAICMWLRARVVPLLEGGARLQQPVKLFAEGLALLDAETFTGPRLATLQRAAREPAGAVKALRQLESHLAIVEQRPKEYFLLFSLLFAAGTQVAMSMAAWKRAHAADMRTWLAAWSEFEALSALGAYAYEHPEDAWPELLPAADQPTYEAEALGHPLLPGAVVNDVTLNAQNRFYLISGSNMSGKSTLLRSIGINAVLAYAGAPVCAARLRLTPLTLGASLALTDSLAEGKSKFLAEVERLSAIVAAARQGPTLFLVDEIFSGTNSADRHTAVQAVVRTLVNAGALGALSTHDLALTAIAEEGSGGQNVHMASPDENDPLAFDYKLKPGINRSSNALAILSMLGLEA